MAFIKHGDGKIMTVVKESELTEEQKELVDVHSEIKQSDTNKTDTSIEKKSGR